MMKKNTERILIANEWAWKKSVPIHSAYTKNWKQAIDPLNILSPKIIKFDLTVVKSEILDLLSHYNFEY